METSLRSTAIPLPLPLSLCLNSQLWPSYLRGSPISSLSRLCLRLSSHLRRAPTPCQYRTRSSYAGAGDGEQDDGDQEVDRNRRRRRRWWSDELPAEMDEGYGEILEEFIDSIWIFKVFRLYGWWLPPILISMLLATGLKAFLLALAVPIGQSTLTLAFKKMWESQSNKPWRGFRAKKKRRGRGENFVELEDEDEKQADDDDDERTRMRYRSWVPDNDGTIYQGNEDLPDFKGWDELDRGREFDRLKNRRSSRIGPSRRKRADFIRRERAREMPLLLRLLIAVFPFLGTWTKML